MENIKTFLENFTKQEAETIYLFRQPNIEEFNKALQKMNEYSVDDLHNKFGMIPSTQLEEPEFYEQWSTKKYPNPRHIYKISQYKDDIYGDVYVAYLSVRNPIAEIFTYGGCLFISRIDNELKIIKFYTFGDPMLIKKKFETSVGGFGDISFKTLKSPVSVERYREPEDEDDSMEHYNKDI
ncbi:MAG: hypothetical protein PSV16_14605 [Flavobacterium sp.]|nr:hypothetical protein [Flavobacterium sp.]